MTRRPGQRVALLVALLSATTLLAGCGNGAAPTAAEPAASIAPPEPVGAGVVTAAPTSSSTAKPPSCDPTVSRRPDAALPAASQLPPGSTMAQIQHRGRLIAGVDQNTFMFGFRNSSTGELEGFDIDIVREIAKAIFGDLDGRIQFKVLTSEQRIPALEQGDVDIVVRTMTINCERKDRVNFSTVYYEAGQRVLVRHGENPDGIDSLTGKKVCAAKGSTSIDNLAKVASKLVRVAVKDWTDCLVMLQQNQVDAISTDDTILAGMAAQDPNTEIVGPRFTSEPYGVAIPKDKIDFVRFVNAVLERMRADGTWKRIYQRWLSRLGPAPNPPEARYSD